MITEQFVLEFVDLTGKNPPALFPIDSREEQNARRTIFTAPIFIDGAGWQPAGPWVCRETIDESPFRRRIMLGVM